ncbi:Amidase domain-containing protein [Aphelenchoides fujianensis]|nr:Amidase domain-containing protein [Aphelenchoides fujianensis]
MCLTTRPHRHLAVPEVWRLRRLAVRFVFFLYFTLVRFAFAVWNFPRARRNVPAPPAAPNDDDRWLLMPAVQLAEAIRRREVSALHVMRVFIQRINQVDATLNAVTRRNFERAEQEAAEVDDILAWLHSNMDEFKNLESKKPLFGVPFTVQNKLRQAGAIPLVLTNCSEAGLWIETSNRVHGTTSNAYDTRRTAGGGCGGEGVLIAAAASPFGLGFDLGGSVRLAGLFNGVFGFKSGPGEMNTIGVLTRYATDLPTLLKILAGPDNAHFFHLKKPADMTKLRVFYLDAFGFPYTSGVDPDILNTLDLVKGYFVSHFDVQPEPLAHPLFGDSLTEWLACIRDPVSRSVSSTLAGYSKDQQIEFWGEFGKWLAGGSTHTTASLLMCFVEQVLPELSEEERKYAMKERERLCHDLTALLDERTILLVWNMLALPVVSTPISLNREGLPVGIQVVSGPQNERLLCDVAGELEYAFGGWKPAQQRSGLERFHFSF